MLLYMPIHSRLSWLSYLERSFLCNSCRHHWFGEIRVSVLLLLAISRKEIKCRARSTQSTQTTEGVVNIVIGKALKALVGSPWHVAPERVERKVWATLTTLALKDDAAWVQDTRDVRNANKCCCGSIWVTVQLFIRVHAKRVVVVAL